MYVKKRGRAGVTFGKSPDTQQYVTVYFQEVLAGVEHDLLFAYARIGHIVIRQKNGIPMGKCSSPPIACCVCIVAEYEWLQSLGQDNVLVDGTRFMDDVQIFIVFVVGDDRYSYDRARRILRSHQLECYDSELTLESTMAVEDVRWEYLETHVVNRPQYPWIYCVHKTKQEELLLAGKPRTLIKTVSYDSYSPYSQKRGVLIGTLGRIYTNCTYKIDVLVSVMVLWFELVLEDFPETIMLQAILAMTVKHGECWEVIYSIMALLLS